MNNKIKEADSKESKKFVFITGFGVVKMLTLLLFTFCFFHSESQSDSTYSFLVAGHAYGAHAGTNIGLHPPFLNKLTENADSSIIAIFLTGDIVNQSTSASWNQVELELSKLGLKSYYVMGNHDNNTLGHAVFKKKHSGDYYSFVYKNELFIILNSTESDRSISKTQLQFLDNLFSNTDAHWERAFIFFHEIIWNSNIKYKLVKSNSRSRYDQLVNISNFWNEVYPRLTSQPEKKFYLFAGDVGGNTDAIAASYDHWENVTLLSSGMGEVKDENFLKVNVLPDTVTFQLIPLNNGIEMKPVTWYNIPEKPDSIFGPVTVFPTQSEVGYQVSPVFNATGYKWNLSSGIYGSSDSSQIILQFGAQFESGKISVAAVNNGFGESEPAELEIRSENNTFAELKPVKTEIEIFQVQNSLFLNFNSVQSRKVTLMIYDQLGRAVFNEVFMLNSGFSSKSIQNNVLGKGLLIISIQTENKLITSKIILY
jgi:hypothetical protein